MNSSLTTSTALPILCAQAPYGQDCCCCKRCNVGGCDLRVVPCGCCLHARCCSVSDGKLLQQCPICGQASSGLHLIPIAFDEIDQALAEAAQTSLTNKRGKKRQNATVARLNPSIAQQQPPSQPQASSSSSSLGDDNNTATAAATATVGSSSSSDSNDLRTGRWTPEETAYCDKLIQLFESGSLPIPEKMKLNDFLSNMLKSKQSRLTKKMKNAKLSAKQYKRRLGFILDDIEAREFSQLETALFGSMKCRMERAELRFHMQKNWRELFSGFCASIGQKLELDAWLRSVEEMERRNSQALDAARRARRKAMIGYALDEDTKNAPTGVMIDPNVFVDRSSQVVVDQNGDFAEVGSETESLVVMTSHHNNNNHHKRPRTGVTSALSNRPKAKSSSFVARVMLYVQQRQIPFEHVDVWAPCAGNNSLDLSSSNNNNNQEQNRLSFAGCATADSKLQPTESRVVPLTSKEQYDLLSFGDYSQRFSFKVGSGLPGRVFSSGGASWEQGIGSAPQSLFERGGGAKQWGIETALGIPVTSPNVGRVVVVFYSIHDRPRDEQLVGRMRDELSRLIPIPRWKLVVDVGVDAPTTNVVPVVNDTRETDLRNMLQGILAGNHNPVNGGLNTPMPQSITGLFPLSQIAFKADRTDAEKELFQQTLNSFEIYKRQGRADLEVIWMTCRDFILREPEIRKQHQAPAPTGLVQFNSQGVAPLLGATTASDQTSCCPPSQSQTQSSSCCQAQPAKSCCPQPAKQQSGCCQQPAAQSSGCCQPPAAPTCQAQAQKQQCNAQQLACCPAPAPAACCAAPQPKAQQCTASNTYGATTCHAQQATVNMQNNSVPTQASGPTEHALTALNNNKNTPAHDPLAPNPVHDDSAAAGTANHGVTLGNHLESFTNEGSEYGGSTDENMDLGVSATQLAQLLQSESAGFTF